MKSKPVRSYALPKYPTRLEVAARPDLLRRHQPPAWRKWPELTGAAGLFLLADAARLRAADSASVGGQNPVQTQAIAVVAPIFEHGEGRGATGCLVMSPPVFLSEEEALRVIREEMAAKGVKLGANQTKLAGVTIESLWKPDVGTKQEPFKADVADLKQKVFVEFLGKRDAWRWDRERQKEQGKFYVSTVQSYDLAKTADYVAQRVRRQATDKIYFGTFYDPLWNFTQKRAVEPPPRQGKSTGYWVIEKGTLTARWMGPGEPPPQFLDPGVESRRLLRLQVQDFIKWLQAQGAI